MEEKIVAVLKESPYPLTAKEISKKIGCSKKEVNQKIFDVKEVEKIHGTQPPRWRLTEGGLPSPKTARTDQDCESSSSASCSGVVSVESPHTPETKASDEDIKRAVTQFLTSQTSPVSAPDISRRIDRNLACITADIKRVLTELQKEGVVTNHSKKGDKPLWTLKNTSQGASNENHATLGNKPLFTLDELADGKKVFTPVTHTKLADTPTDTTKPKQVNVVAPNSDTGSDQMFATQTATDEKPELLSNLSSSSETPKSSSQACKKKSPINLAVNFSNISLSDSSDEDEALREKIIQFLQSNPEKEFNLHAIASAVGSLTRDKVLYELTKIANENLVEELTNGCYKFLQDAKEY